ncbi:MAG: c-type cytochrome domain-containing protein, partial [Verrucomicrobiota bacterium]
MKRSILQSTFLGVIFLITSYGGSRAADEAINFTRDIQPILEFHCVACHDENKTKGGLRFDRAELFFQGGDGGDALIKGKPEESLLLELVSLPHDDFDVMPPEGRKLNDTEIAKLSAWIEQGAAWPEDLLLVARDEADFKGAEPLEDIGKAIVKVEAFPPDIVLEKARDAQSVVVMATYEDDTTRDVTANASFVFENPELVSVEKRNRFGPVADGETNLVVAVGEHEMDIPVKVVEAEQDRPVSFHLDVMPVFMRDGCNIGACHGSARGQDGFMLSLFGYDPMGDHYRLTREMAGHRINLAIPEESLLVEKSIEAVPHTGGKLMEKGSHGYNTLVEWIRDGAGNDDPAEVPYVTDLVLYPPKLVLEGSGATQQMTVRAKYSDGHDRDVSHLAVFMTSNEPTAGVSKDGLVTAGKRGESFIMARYETKTVGIQTIVIPEGLEYTQPTPAENNFIDGLVHDKLHKLRITPSGDCTDEEF